MANVELKDNFYRNGRKAKDIEMPPLDQIPPVLADNPSDWGGNNQKQQDVQQETQEIEYDEPSSTDVVEDQEQEIPEEPVVQEKPKPSSKDSGDNLRILREAREKAERERDELMRYVMDMQKQQTPVQKPEVVQEEVESDFSVEDDILLEGKHGKQLYKKLQQMEKKLAQYESKSSESIVESRIKSEFPDFDSVVNQENINRLNQDFPEIATTLRDTKDLYSKATAAYKIMKKFGIYKDKTYDQDKQIALKNASKPRTVTSLNPQQGDSPLSKANAFASGMTKDLQAQLLKEMADARKNL